MYMFLKYMIHVSGFLRTRSQFWVLSYSCSAPRN